VKARLFDSDALEGIGLFRGDDIEERADLTFRQHVVVIGATSAGASGLAGGILNELTDLFFEVICFSRSSTRGSIEGSSHSGAGCAVG